MTSKKELTIYDLAERLNLSIATVSRALNNDPTVNKKTKRKVCELAEAMGYRKNNFASGLRMQKTNTIGIIVHELNSHFIASVLSGIEEVLTAAEYIIVIGHSSESSVTEVANANNLFHKRVDGLIVSLANDTVNLDHYDPFVKRGIPIVFFDRVRKEAPGIKVIIDNEKAGYEATAHLIQQGCRRLMHITGNLAQNVYVDRLNGFKKALRDKNLPDEPGHVLVTDLSERAGREVARQILELKRKPDGLFFSNDLCAAVCMKTLKEAGIKVPQEIAVVGFNNDTISRLVEPQLSTVNYAGSEMGRVAANNLLSQLNSSLGVASYTVVLTSQLMIRESSLRYAIL
ncbi:LacI family DNA-binding transcriptional regulator [Niastella sp. OAS944]|uniref:LacI family DNA-binding transcriptional regulator n=1 Tax=Niastella sp. OAS944 TaxID=2664089 RepID=UPI0034746F0F|nr:LacI family transcriptional regulator [Chitinophagaceae bacterium OAS944]